ncbi:uncharacterized protein [Littorina saxatilis]
MTAAETPGSPEKPNAAYFVKNYGECVHIGVNQYTLVTSCPEHYSDVRVKTRCKDVNMTSPVSHVQEPSIVFKNSHCVECHNMESNSTVEWKRRRLQCTDFPIKTPQDVIEAFQNGRCKMISLLSPPTNKAPRSCSSSQSQAEMTDYRNLTEVEGECLPHACSKPDELLCKAYKFPRHYSAANTTLESVYEACLSISKTYDNPHCAKCCTGCTFPELTDTTCSTSNLERSDYETSGSQGIANLGIVTMFELSEDGLGVMVDGQLITWPGFNCADDEVYDHLDKVCRKLTCPPRYELLEKRCVPVDSLVPGSSQLLPNGTRLMFVEFRLASNESCNRYIFRDDWRILPPLGETEMTYSCSNDDLTLRMNFSLPSDGNFNLMYEAFWVAFKQILVNEKIFVSIMLSNHDHDTTVQDVSSVCPDGKLPLVLDEANMTRKDGRIFVVFRKNGFQQLYPLENVYFSFLLSRGKSEESEVLKGEGLQEPNKTGNVILAGSMDEHSFVLRSGFSRHPEPMHTVLQAELCEQEVGNSSLLCATLEYPKNQTQIDNGTLVILESGMVFALDEYEVHDDRVFVCSHFKNLNDFWTELKFFDFSHEQFYLMLILTALSVLLLAFVLVVYFLLPELRTLPGKVTISHVACLLVGHLTLMVEVPCKTCCHFVAALSHFVWLAAFAWVSCLAVHMALTFFTAAVSQKSRYEADRVFRRYSLVCWGLPLAVVATCAVLDFSPSINFEVGYGEKVCGWIGESKATVWFFFVPLGISLLVNLLAFFAAVFGIERTTRASSMASSRRSEGKRLLVYVKMSAALGFTWVLGLGVAFGQWVWLMWIFAILNSLQGAFIAMAFLVNERVLRMLKKKLRGKARMGEKCHSGSADQTQSVSVSTTAASVSDARI